MKKGLLQESTGQYLITTNSQLHVHMANRSAGCELSRQVVQHGEVDRFMTSEAIPLVLDSVNRQRFRVDCWIQLMRFDL